MKEVKNSSNIEAFGHENGRLTIRFKGGSTYDYDSVPAEVHADMSKHHDEGGSVGKWFHANIKNKFVGVKREGEK